MCFYPPVDEQAGFGYMCEDCCRCHSKDLPEWLEVNEAIPPFADNKHTTVQVTISSLHNTNVIVVFELLHGLYYQDFKDKLQGITELTIHTPSRADYTPSDPANGRGFFALLTLDDLLGRNLPYNLPMTSQRVPGTSNQFEY